MAGPVGDRPPSCLAGDFDLEAAIAEFLADTQRSSLELPHMSPEERKRVRRLTEQHPELSCESFGFGAERQLHIFRASSRHAPVGLTARDAWSTKDRSASLTTIGAKSASHISTLASRCGQNVIEPTLLRSRHPVQPKLDLQPYKREEPRAGSEPTLLRPRRPLLPKGALLAFKKDGSKLDLSPISEGLEDLTPTSSPARQERNWYGRRQESASPRRLSLRMSPPDGLWLPPPPAAPGTHLPAPPPPPALRRSEGTEMRNAYIRLPGHRVYSAAAVAVDNCRAQEERPRMMIGVPLES